MIKGILILIIIAMVSCHSIYGQKPEAIREYNAGLEYYNLRNYETAIPFFKQATEKDPNFVYAYRTLIACYEQLGQGSKAAEVYVQVIEVSPSDKVLPYNLALTYISLKEYNNAVAYLKKSLRIDPTYTKAANKLEEVKTYLDKQKQKNTRVYIEAEESDKIVYNKALEFYTAKKYEDVLKRLNGYYGEVELPDFYYLKAISLQHLGRREEAIAAYEQVLEVDDRHFNTNLNLGKIYFNNKNYEEAIKLLETAYERRPKDSKLLNALAKALFYSNKYKAAADNLEKYIEIKPKDGDAWVMLGNCYSKLNKSKNAARAFEMAQKYGSKSDEISNQIQNAVTIYGRKASQMTQNGNFQGAIAVLEQAIKEHSKEASLHFNLGLNYMEIDNYNKARIEFKKAIDLDATHAKAYQALGLIYYEKEEYSQAAAYYQATVDAGKHDEYVYYKLGSCYFKLKRMTDAVDAYLKAIEKNKEVKQFYFGIALVYIAEKENLKSIDALRKALALDPNYLDAQYHICVNHIAMNNYDKGIEEAQKILDKDVSYAKAYLVIGHCYKRKGDYIMAEKYQAKAVQLDPTLRE